MQVLNLEGTEDTPKIILDKNNNHTLCHNYKPCLLGQINFEKTLL